MRIFITLGSGGHSTEMKKLIQNEFSSFTIVAASYKGDDDFNSNFSSRQFHSRIALPRATSPNELSSFWLWRMMKAFWAILCSLMILTRELSSEDDEFHFILTNGPSISIPVVLYFYTKRLLFGRLNGSECKIIFIESITRVKKLSLSARIVHPFVDELIVWWPELAQHRGCTKCRFISLIE